MSYILPTTRPSFELSRRRAPEVGENWGSGGGGVVEGGWAGGGASVGGGGGVAVGGGAPVHDNN